MLRCRDGTLYTGYTVDPARRLARHQAGTAARYTRGRQPVTLVGCWAFPTVGAALREEARLKRLPRRAKEALLEESTPDGGDPDASIAARARA